MTTAPEAPAAVERRLRHLDLELAGHGGMTPNAWKTLIDDGIKLGLRTVQFIGEPTVYSAFDELVLYALERGLGVRVFSSLYRVRPEHWLMFQHPRLTLATSYYSDQAVQHDAITGRRGSHARTRAAIVEAVRRKIPIRVSVTHMREGQRVQEARVEMLGLGVNRVDVDDVRVIGSAASRVPPPTSALCGRCGDGAAAVLSDGTVAPCAKARFLPAGTVRGGSLISVLSSTTWGESVARVPRTPGKGRAFSACMSGPVPV